LEKIQWAEEEKAMDRTREGEWSVSLGFFPFSHLSSAKSHGLLLSHSIYPSNLTLGSIHIHRTLTTVSALNIVTKINYFGLNFEKYEG
jgi:hypothetical protein